MKNYWLILIPLAAGAIFALGRLTAQPKIVTERVVEYHTTNTSALTAIKVSEPIGSRIERVMLRTSLFPNINHLRDTTKMDVQEDNFPIIDHSGNSTIMVDHIEEMREMVDSAEVELPIRDYTFSDDSTYTITARGVYVESLPQVEFYPRTIKTRTEQVVRTPRITHGFQMGGGVAYTPQGFQPAVYIGYGLAIRF